MELFLYEIVIEENYLFFLSFMFRGVLVEEIIINCGEEKENRI